MRAIRISESVWDAIAERGKFGETEDDVLRRVFGLPPDVESLGANGQTSARQARRGRRRGRNRATRRLSAYVEGDRLALSFANGPERTWKLPARSDKEALRVVREKAVAFAKDNDATTGQVNAVKKALTEAGYYLTK